MKLKLRYVVLILIVAFLVPIAACTSLALRYESLDDDAESISLVPDWPDVTYCVMDGVPLKLDFYTPKDATVGPHPTLVYVHGGGWTGGDKRKGSGITDIPGMVERGYIVAAVNYRRAPEYRFPAPLQDAKCAVRFLRANAITYHVNADKIGIWGGSAGGHLASLVGLTDSSAGFDVGEYSEQSSRVTAVVDMFGPADLTMEMSLLRKLLLYRAFGTLSPQAPILSYASPVNYISKQAPPFLILQGEQDDVVPLAQAQRFYARLQATGVQVELLTVKNANHNFAPTGGPIDPSRAEITRRMGEFFDRWLR